MSEATYPVSVVIATLGGESLRRTLDMLNKDRRVPAQILICIPAPEASRVAAFATGNITVVETPCRGQVGQRAYGFGKVTESLVLQLDDDILVEPGDMRALMDAAERLGPGNVVAPIYCDLESKRCLHSYRRGFVGWLQDAYAVIVCGAKWGKARMGTISPAGVCYGVDKALCSEQLRETQWVPGGCVLSFRENIVAESFFPFAGKAYCEDLIHSLLRRSRGLRLWIAPTAHCATPAAPPARFAWAAMNADLKARLHVVRMANGSRMRLALWFATDILRRAATSAMNSLMRGSPARSERR